MKKVYYIQSFSDGGYWSEVDKQFRAKAWMTEYKTEQAARDVIYLKIPYEKLGKGHECVIIPVYKPA